MTHPKPTTLLRSLGIAALITMLVSVGPSAVAAPANQAGTDLFTDAVVERAPNIANVPTVVRARFVEINLDLLGGAGGRLQTRPDVADVLRMNLFEDVAFTAVLDRTEPNPSGSLSWIGHLEGIAYSVVNLVVKDGIVAGSIAMPGAFYQVRYTGDGVHAVQEIDQAAFPPELEPIPTDSSLEPAAGTPLGPMADDGSTIDVLVVYTNDARATVGGTTAMQNLIDQAMLETNQSYANSGISQRVRLVHTEEVAYDESGFDWPTTLWRLRDPTDGHIDQAPTLRDNYCADEVVLIVSNTDSCGIAFVTTTVPPYSSNTGFAVVSYDCATGYYSFAHEMGHNMGARHDWYVDEDVTPYTYAHGYVNAADRWRTIMAYNTECSDQGVYCQRLQYWSNPDVTYGGDPMGVPAGTSAFCSEGVPNPNCDADNRQTLNNTAYYIANFRDSSVCGPPSYDISGYVRDSVGGGISGVTVDFGGAQPTATTNSSGYYEQSGFDEGDYIVSFSRSGYVFSPVEDQVTISGADAVHDTTGYPFNPASLPFIDGLEGGGLGSAWAVETDYEGRVRVDTAYPHAGSYGLLLDDDTAGGFYSHASAILALDLSDQSQVGMSFWWREFSDEDHPDDGVFISDDYGANWYRAFSFNGGPATFTQATVDLDAKASDAGMSLNDHFLIKFQFYGDRSIGSDGYAIDDVVVAGEGLVYHGHSVDDDTAGLSNGNDDGRINCGENVELSVDLFNRGLDTVTPTVATIHTTDPYITWTHNVTSTYPGIPGLGTGTNSDAFEFEVDPNTPHAHTVQFDLSVDTTDGGPWTSDFDVRVYCATDNVYLPLVIRDYGTSTGDILPAQQRVHPLAQLPVEDVGHAAAGAAVADRIPILLVHRAVDEHHVPQSQPVALGDDALGLLHERAGSGRGRRRWER